MAGAVPLVGEGELQLGGDTDLAFEVEGEPASRGLGEAERIMLDGRSTGPADIIGLNGGAVVAGLSSTLDARTGGAGRRGRRARAPTCHPRASQHALRSGAGEVPGRSPTQSVIDLTVRGQTAAVRSTRSGGRGSGHARWASSQVTSGSIGTVTSASNDAVLRNMTSSS